MRRIGAELVTGATFRVTLPEGSPVRLSDEGDEIALYRGDEEVHRVSYENAGAGEVIRFEASETGDGGAVPDPCCVHGQPADEPLRQAFKPHPDRRVT